MAEDAQAALAAAFARMRDHGLRRQVSRAGGLSGRRGLRARGAEPARGQGGTGGEFLMDSNYSAPQFVSDANIKPRRHSDPPIPHGNGSVPSDPSLTGTSGRRKACRTAHRGRPAARGGRSGRRGFPQGGRARRNASPGVR